LVAGSNPAGPKVLDVDMQTGQLLYRQDRGDAFVLTVSGGEITRFRMLEDSFAVSRAARIQSFLRLF
jgi:ketosteroid isomerase-like protein